MASAANNTEREVLRAFYDGIEEFYFTKYKVRNTQTLRKEKNISLILNYEEPVASEYAVQFGTAKDRSIDHHACKALIKEKCRNIIYLETPIIGRTINEKHLYEYYRVGVNGFLNQQGMFFDLDSVDPDRLAKFRYDFALPKKIKWRDSRKGHILLLVQLPGDMSLRGQKMGEWVMDTVEVLRSMTEQQIVIRLHPAMSAKGVNEFMSDISMMMLKNHKNVRFSDGRQTSLQQDLAEAGLCVNYSSGAGVDAVLAGVPTITTDRGGMAYPVSASYADDLGDLILPSDEDIEEWLLALSHSQWSLPEMRSGKAFKNIEPILTALSQ